MKTTPWVIAEEGGKLYLLTVIAWLGLVSLAHIHLLYQGLPYHIKYLHQLLPSHQYVVQKHLTRKS